MCLSSIGQVGTVILCCLYYFGTWWQSLHHHVWSLTRGQRFYADIICLSGVKLQGSSGMIELKSSTLIFDPSYFIHTGQAVPLFSIHISNSERGVQQQIGSCTCGHLLLLLSPCLYVCVCKGDAATKGGCVLREDWPGRGKEEKDKKRTGELGSEWTRQERRQRNRVWAFIVSFHPPAHRKKVVCVCGGWSRGWGSRSVLTAGVKQSCWSQHLVGSESRQVGTYVCAIVNLCVCVCVCVREKASPLCTAMLTSNLDWSTVTTCVWNIFKCWTQPLNCK